MNNRNSDEILCAQGNSESRDFFYFISKEGQLKSIDAWCYENRAISYLFLLLPYEKALAGGNKRIKRQINAIKLGGYFFSLVILLLLPTLL